MTVHDTVRRAARIMTEAGTDALPVLDDRGVLVGLITATDLVALLAGAPRRHGPAVSGGRRQPPEVERPPVSSDFLPRGYRASGIRNYGCRPQECAREDAAPPVPGKRRTPLGREIPDPA